MAKQPGFVVRERKGKSPDRFSVRFPTRSKKDYKVSVKFDEKWLAKRLRAIFREYPDRATKERARSMRRRLRKGLEPFDGYDGRADPPPSRGRDARLTPKVTTAQLRQRAVDGDIGTSPTPEAAAATAKPKPGKRPRSGSPQESGISDRSGRDGCSGCQGPASPTALSTPASLAARVAATQEPQVWRPKWRSGALMPPAEGRPKSGKPGHAKQRLWKGARARVSRRRARKAGEAKSEAKPEAEIVAAGAVADAAACAKEAAAEAEKKAQEAVEEERRRAVAAQARLEEERLRELAAQERLAEEAAAQAAKEQRVEAMRQCMEAEAALQKAREATMKAEEDAQMAQAQAEQAKADAKRALAEAKRAEAEMKKAEAEAKKAEAQRQQSEREAKRARKEAADVKKDTGAKKPEKKKCIVCGESRANGVLCRSSTEPHFTCRNCFDHYVSTLAKEEPGAILKRGGQVPCPGTSSHPPFERCRAEPWRDQTVAKLVTRETYDAHRDAEQKIQETKTDEAARVAVNREAESPNAPEREARRIQETVLLNRCPKCTMAFIDWRDCCALKCARCATDFCAWCLRDCSGDADPHVHVFECGGINNVFLLEQRHKQKLQRRWKERQQRLLEAHVERLRLAGVQRPFLDQVHALVQPHLGELRWPAQADAAAPPATVAATAGAGAPAPVAAWGAVAAPAAVGAQAAIGAVVPAPLPPARPVTVKIDPAAVPRLIGKGGQTVRGLRQRFSVSIEIFEDEVRVAACPLEPSLVEEAVQEIKRLAETVDIDTVEVPEELVGAVIGTKGAVINELQRKHGVRISRDRVEGKFVLKGAAAAVQVVKQMLTHFVRGAAVSEKRVTIPQRLLGLVNHGKPLWKQATEDAMKPYLPLQCQAHRLTVRIKASENNTGTDADLILKGPQAADTLAEERVREVVQTTTSNLVKLPWFPGLERELRSLERQLGISI